MTIPSAEPFSAVGFFNGFPLVDTQWDTRKVDVSTYDRYEALTLEQAVNIYFNVQKHLPVNQINLVKDVVLS